MGGHESCWNPSNVLLPKPSWEHSRRWHYVSHRWKQASNHPTDDGNDKHIARGFGGILQRKHPFWKSKRRIDMQNTRFGSPLQMYAQYHRATGVSRIETIEPYSAVPWTDRLTICIAEDREQAIEQAMNAVSDLRVGSLLRGQVSTQ
jgi:hypothetical protein